MTSRGTLAFRYMWRQKMRTGFVVVTFVAAVTVTLLLTSAIVGSEQTFLSEVNGLGVNTIYVEPGSSAGPGSSSSGVPAYPLTLNDSQAITEDVPHISAVAPIMYAGVIVPSWGGESELVGTYSSIQQVFNYVNYSGSFDLNWSGSVTKPIPVVLGYDVWSSHALSVGQLIPASVVSLSVNGGSSTPVNLVVTGDLAQRGYVAGTNLDAAAFVPILALEKLVDSISLTFIFVSATASQYVDNVTNSLNTTLYHLHDDSYDFTILSEESWVSYIHTELSQFTSIISLVEATLLMLSSMSVFVVMTMAVKDRKREIGVMRALGAHRSDIMGQFLLEASIMSLSGMAMGVIIGTLVAGYLKAHAGGFYSYLLTNPLSLGLYFAELLVILWAVGFLFSLVPAYQASRLEAVEALNSL